MTWYDVVARMRGAAAETIPAPWTWWASLAIDALLFCVFAWLLFKHTRRRNS